MYLDAAADLPAELQPGAEPVARPRMRLNGIAILDGDTVPRGGYPEAIAFGAFDVGGQEVEPRRLDCPDAHLDIRGPFVTNLGSRDVGVSTPQAAETKSAMIRFVQYLRSFLANPSQAIGRRIGEQFASITDRA
jgi:hypothetical protein